MDLTRAPRVVVRPHPLTAEGGRIHLATVTATVADLAGRLLPGVRPDDVVATLDGAPLPRGAAWNRPLGPDRLVTLAVAARGDDGAKVVRTVTSIAALVATAMGHPEIGAIILIAGGVIQAALVPRPPSAHDPEDPTPRYSLDAGSNRARRHQPAPLVLGSHRLYPDLQIREHTRYDSDEQYFSTVLGWGVGDLEIGDLMLGDTPLIEYPEVEVQHRGPGAAVTLVETEVETVAGADLDDTETWHVRRSAPRATRIELDFAGTLLHVDERGRYWGASVSVAVERRRVGAAVWGDHLPVHVHGDRTPNPTRLTVSIDVPDGHQWEVRLRRVTPVSTGQDLPDDQPLPAGRHYRDERGLQNRLVWTAMRSFEPDGSTPPTHRTAIRIRASGRLSGRLERVHAIVGQRIPLYDATAGAWGAPAVTSNPAAIYRAYCLGFRSGGTLVAGIGYPAARVDDVALGEWYRWCERHDLRCDLVVTTGTHERVLADVARCGRASPTWSGGKCGVVWDDPDTPATALVTPGNIVAGSLEVAWSSGQAAEIVGQYVDREAGWEQREVRRAVSGAAGGAPSVVRLPGVTTRDLAARAVNLLAAGEVHHPRVVAWEMGREALTLPRGAVVVVSHALLDGGVTGRCVSLSAGEAVLGDVEVGAGDVLLLSLPDGTLHQTAVQPGAARGIARLNDPLDSLNASPADVLWRLYPAAAPRRQLQIVGWEPVEMDRYRLIARDHVPEYYAAERLPLDAHINPVSYAGAKVVGIYVAERLVRAGGSWIVELTAVQTVSGDWRGGVVLAAYEEHPARRVATLDGANLSVSWIEPAAGTVTVTAFPGSAVAPAGPGLSVSYEIVGVAEAPAPPTNFLIDVLGDGTGRFRWTLSPSPDVRGYRLRWREGRTGTWEQMTPLHDGLLTSSPYDSRDLPGGEYRIALRAEDVTGQLSDPVYVVATLPALSGSAAFRRGSPSANGWPGQLDPIKVARSNDGRDAVEGAGDYTWATAPATWDEWTTWGAGDGTQGHTTIGYNSEEIDLGRTLTFVPRWSAAVVGSVELMVESGVAPLGAPGPWVVSPQGRITARYVRLRWRVRGTADQVLSLDHLTWRLEGEADVEVLSDSDTATWVAASQGARLIPLSGRLSHVTGVSVTLQNVGQGWSWDLLSKSPPQIRIYDQSRRIATAVVDVVVHGIAA